MGGLRCLGILFVLLALPAFAFAAGKHDGLNCTGCHGIHTAKGEIIFAVEANKKSVNPKTKQPYTGITALCLGCHETIEKGGLGILAVSASHSHPYGVTANPKVALVPAVFLRDQRLDCVGCHDPHPSNTNYKYLRVDTAKGAKMQDFCAMCHPAKADPKVLKELKIFDSMDERKFAPPMKK
ncbi:MAG: cytochrome c3 family protein [Nitrospirota bacterium]|nr:cytochrome c3 family protein [Nitrospirota bacterium]